MMKTGLFSAVGALLYLCAIVAGSAQASERYIVPNPMLAELPAGIERIHDYGQRSLVSVPGEDRQKVDLRRASRLEHPEVLSYRSWRARVQETPASLAALNEAYFIVALVGPLDPAWRGRLQDHGLRIVDHVNPYGLVVHGDAAAIKAAAAAISTSENHPVITHALPLPDASRVSPLIAELMSGRSTAGDLGVREHDGKLLVEITLHDDTSFAEQQSTLFARLQPGPDYTEANPYSRQFQVQISELATLLDSMPGIAFIEPVHPRVLHNNIAVQAHLTNIKPVWDNYSYTGSGLIAGVNDSGLDLSHADFPAGSVVATSGAMANTDTAHGTHVTGTVMGRGAYPSPNNTHACGDVTTPLPDARGMAHGAQVVHNNIFDGGIGNEAAMMTWQSQQGAVVNNNSWGYGSIFGPATDYGSQTVAVDAAVRNADPAGSINAQMAIVFSAGNSDVQGVSKPANGKNVITVGASQNDRCGAYIPSNCAGPDIDGMACFSSQGPSQQRIKPDIVAPGTDILSSESSDPQSTHPWDQPWTGPHLSTSPGTSMSSPVVTGAALLFFEHYQTTYGQLPSPALVKAALINTATDIGLGYPSNVQGWGRLNLLKAIEGPVEDGILLFDQHEVDHLQTGQSWTTQATVGSTDEPLRISLVWTDPAGSSGCSVCHINDLDLVVTAPDGTIYRGNQFSSSWSAPNATGRDSLNNVENVYVELPASGEYSIEVIAHNVAQNPNLLSGQDFALVVTGDLGGLQVDPGTVEVCMADGSTDFTLTLSSLFDGTTQLSATAIPAGTSGSFSVNPVVFPADSSVFTLSELELAAAGEHLLEFFAADDDDSDLFAAGAATLMLYSDVPQGYDLLAPPDQVTDTVLRPGFAWSAADEATSYHIQIATDEGFGSIVIDELISENSFVPDSDLATGTRYYWRVGSSNVCGDGGWSEVFEFQTRFEPLADVSPLTFEFEVPQNGLDSQPLTIANVGTGNLVWDIDTDQTEAGMPGSRAHDPALDETFVLGDFSLPGHATEPPPVVFEVPAGLVSRGEVVGFSFSGSATAPGSAWASDSCMIVEAPDGTIYSVGGFSSYAPHCGPNHRDAEWDFQGGGSSGSGSYTSVHDDVFDPALDDEGTWTFTFLNAWLSGSAGTTQWTDVEVTLHKQPLPVCFEDLTDVAWLNTSPASGSVAAGDSDAVLVQVDASGMAEGEHIAWLCLTTNAQGQELIPIPVELTVTEQVVGQLKVEPAALSYGEVDVGDLISQSVTVSNAVPPGAPAIELLDLVLSETDSWSVNGDCQPGTVLSPGDECLVEISFSPVVVGVQISELEITTVAGQSAGVALDGIGQQEPAELLIDPHSLAFDPTPVGNATTQSVTISNEAAAGAADLHVDQIGMVVGAPDFVIKSNGCAATVSPQTHCDIVVEFAPTLTQIRSGVLRIVVDGEIFNLSLSGSGVEPEPIIFEDRFEVLP